MATAHHTVHPGDGAGVGTLALLRDLYTCTLALCQLLWQVVCAAGAAGLCRLLAEAVRVRETAVAASAAALILSSAAADAARRAVAQIEVMKPSSAAPGRPRSRSTEGGAAAQAAPAIPAQRRRSCPGGPAAAPPPLLPPQLSHHAGRLTVVLDLDETLIAPPRAPAGPASPRSPPSPTGGAFGAWTGVKDLSLLGRDLRRVVLVDNNVSSMQLQPQNGVPCLPFRGDPADRVLLDVMLPLLLSLAEFDGDVRPILDSQIRLSSWLATRGRAQQGAAGSPATTPTSSTVPA